MKKYAARFTACLLAICLISATIALPSFASAREEETPVVETSDNVLFNPGFEDGMRFWSGGEGVTLSTEEAHTGTQSLRLEKKGDFSDWAYQVDIYVTAGTYDFSFYYKCDSSTDSVQLGTGFLWQERSDGTSHMEPLAVGSSDWKKVSIRVHFAWDGFINLLLIPVNYDRPLYLDDFSLVPADSLVLNNSFEEGLEHWNVSESEDMMFSDSTLQARTGDSSLMISGTQAQYDSGISQTCLITGPGYYELTAYVKAAYPFTGDGVVVSISGEDPDGNMITERASSGSNITDGWTPVTCRLYVPPQVYALSIAITSIQSRCVFLVDDVDLKRISSTPIGNLLENEGFEESYLYDWITQGWPPATVTTAEKHAGEQAVMFQSNVSEGFHNYIEQNVNLYAAGMMEFSVYVKTGEDLAGVGAVLFLEALDAEERVLATANSSAVSQTNESWQKLSVRLEIPEDARSVTVKIGGLYYTGTFYIDDASLSHQISVS